MVVLLLLVKEDVWLVLVPLGIYVAVRHNRKMGLVTAGLAVAWFCLMMFVVQPALSGHRRGSIWTRGGYPSGDGAGCWPRPSRVPGRWSRTC